MSLVVNLSQAKLAIYSLILLKLFFFNLFYIAFGHMAEPGRRKSTVTVTVANIVLCPRASLP